MASIIVSPSADADMGEILEDLAKKSGARTAAKYDQRFDDLYNHLSLYPERCPRRPKVAAQTRIGIVLPYVVLYRYSKSDDAVVIQRIVHGHRRLTGKLLREEK